MDVRQRTIEEMHRRFSGVLFDLCLRMLGDRAAAEDAVQETFVSAFRALDSFTYGESHLPWLYRIATNACLKMIRTRKRKPLGLMEDMSRAADARRDPVRAIHYRRVLESLVDELDERGQEIFAAHFIILKDPKFIGRMQVLIETGTPASQAICEVARKYVDLFADSPHS